MEWRNRISIDPEICHGMACIQGTRVPIAVILDNLAAAISHREICETYGLNSDDIYAAIAYASSLAKEQFVMLEAG